MLKLRQETTVWPEGSGGVNHTYIFDEPKLGPIGYIPVGTTVAKYFSKRSTHWNGKGRTFRDLGKSEMKEITL